MKSVPLIRHTSEMNTSESLYRRHRFPSDIISRCVWLYFRFSLSFRDVEELMSSRGVSLTYEAVREWCLKFGQNCANGLRRNSPRAGDRWHLDEVFLKINGRAHYLWRARQGIDMLDSCIYNQRDMKSKPSKANISIESIAEQCVAVRLRLLTRAVNKLYNKALRPHGLTVSQMNILVAVSCLKEAIQQDVCHVLHLDRSTLSRDVERMRTQGWVTTSSGEDGRTSLLKLTTNGRRLLQEVIPAWETAQRQATELLGTEHVATLDRAAKALRSSTTKR